MRTLHGLHFEVGLPQRFEEDHPCRGGERDAASSELGVDQDGLAFVRSRCVKALSDRATVADPRVAAREDGVGNADKVERFGQVREE